MSNKIINVWAVAHTELAETLSFKVVCDQDIAGLICAIAYKDEMTKEEIALELSNLLERSIYLNLPRSHRFWNKGKDV